MLGAIKAASEGMGINRAALEFGVPKTTLKDRMPGRVQHGRVQHGSKLGRVPYLSSSEEQELVDYLITCSEDIPRNELMFWVLYKKPWRIRMEVQLILMGKDGGFTLCNAILS